MATTIEEPTTLPSTSQGLPPGPRPLPLVGNLLSLQRDPLGFLQDVYQKYGSIATIHLGKQPIVLLMRPEYVRYILIEHPRDFTNRDVTVGNDDDSGFTEGLLTIDGDHHRQQRRAVQPAFHKKRVESYATIMNQYTQELLQTWHAGDTINMSRAMQELTMRIVSSCLFSIDIARQLDDLGDIFNNLIGQQAGLLETLFNVRIDNPLTSYGKRRAAIRRLNMLIYTLISQRKTEHRDYGDVLSMLMEARSGGDEDQPLTDKQIHDHIATFIAAGHETTANALVWTFYLLSAHPRIREKLLDEITSVLGDRQPTVEDIPNLPYTDWVLQESMRLYPPAWLQLRHATKDFELDGVKIPAGTNVMTSQWVLHRLPDIWKDPNVFRPERWNPAAGETVPQGAYFPFGAGPRICIGMPLAQLEAKIILVSILQRFTPQTISGYRLEVNPLITLRPKRNLEMVLLSTAARDSSLWENTTRGTGAIEELNASRKGCLGMLLSLGGLLRL